MKTEVSLYDPEKISRLKNVIIHAAEKGTPRYYEIYIDSLKVIGKTANPDEFDDYEAFIHEDSKMVCIKMFTGSERSGYNDKHEFYFDSVPPEKMQELNGFGNIQKIIDEKVSLIEERSAHNKLVEEYEKTKAKLAEADEYIDKLTEELEKYKSKKLHLGNVNLGEVASIVLEGFIRRNPQMLTKFPGGQALAGMIEQDNLERQQANQQLEPDAEVSMKKKSASDNLQSLSPEQQEHLQLLAMLEASLDQKELNTVVLILDRFIKDSTVIAQVAELLDIPQAPDNL